MEVIIGLAIVTIVSFTGIGIAAKIFD